MTIIGGLLEASIRSVVLAGTVFFLLWILRVREASWRHSAWTAVLVAMTLMPFLPGLVPPVPPAAAVMAAPVEPLVALVEPVRP